MARTKVRAAPPPSNETRLHELIRARRWDEVRSYLKTPEGGAEAKRCRCAKQCPQDLGEGAGRRRCVSKPLALALWRARFDTYHDQLEPPPADIIITLLHLDAESAKMESVHILAKYDKTGEVVQAWLKAHPEGAKKRDDFNGYLPLHVAALYDKTGNVFKIILEANPAGVFDVGSWNMKSPLELAENEPTAELLKNFAFECCGRENVVNFIDLQRERKREKRKKEREERERQRMKERNDMEQKHKKQREELEREHKEERENIERRHKRKREEEREEERKDEREELESEHKRKREEEREEREREHERKNDCPICLEALNAQECACTPCGHIFHRECVGKSLRSGSAECPTCREKFRSLNLRTIYLP